MDLEDVGTWTELFVDTNDEWIQTWNDLIGFNFLFQIASEGFFRISDIVFRGGITIDPISDANVALENETQG